jgi:hypothetical protein
LNLSPFSVYETTHSNWIAYQATAVNTTAQMEKGRPAQVSDIKLVAAETKGSLEAEPTEREAKKIRLSSTTA